MIVDFLSKVVEWDTDLLLALNGMRAAWADSFMYAFSGKLVWIPMYAAILYVIARNFHWKTTLYCVIAVALTITFADQVCATLIRPFVCRLRPANLENPISVLVQIVNDHRGGRYGFPSCHAANTFGLAFFIWFLFRKRWLTVFIMVWAVLTCYSRAYLGVHYPGDLLAGAIVGFVGAACMYGLFRKVSGYQRMNAVKQLYAPIWVGGCTIAILLIDALVEASSIIL